MITTAKNSISLLRCCSTVYEHMASKQK